MELFITENKITLKGFIMEKLTIYYLLFIVISVLFIPTSNIAQYEYCNTGSGVCNGLDLGNYTKSGQAWTKNELKYYFKNGTNTCQGDDEKLAFYYAFNTWSSAVPLVFSEVFNENEADIVIHYVATSVMLNIGLTESYVAASFLPDHPCKGKILLNEGYWGFSISPNPPSGYLDLYSIALQLH